MPGYDTGPEAKYLIWSFEHRMWWAPQAHGYVRDVARAGRYTADETVEVLCDIKPPGEEVPVREDEARDDRWPANTTFPPRMIESLKRSSPPSSLHIPVVKWMVKTSW